MNQLDSDPNLLFGRWNFPILSHAKCYTANQTMASLFLASNLGTKWQVRLDVIGTVDTLEPVVAKLQAQNIRNQVDNTDATRWYALYTDKIEQIIDGKSQESSEESFLKHVFGPRKKEAGKHLKIATRLCQAQILTSPVAILNRVIRFFDGSLERYFTAEEADVISAAQEMIGMKLSTSPPSEVEVLSSIIRSSTPDPDEMKDS